MGRRAGFSFDILKLAFIRAVKQELSKLTKCAYCKSPHTVINCVDFDGLGDIYLCDGCIEEWSEYIFKQNMCISSGFGRLLSGQSSSYAKKCEDYEDISGIYSQHKYILDHSD